MEKAFQQILTEIYHIVSKKAVDADDKRTGVSLAACRAGQGGRLGWQRAQHAPPQVPAACCLALH